MSRKAEKKETTTIAVSSADNKRITKHCKSLSIQKKEFVPIILDYLENNGVNPKTDHAPKTELAQIKKRIDQYFGFIKTQEKVFLRPMFEAVQATENRLQQDIDNLVMKNDLQNLTTKKHLVNVMRDTSNLLGELFENYGSWITKLEKKMGKISDEMEVNRKNRIAFQEKVIERLDQLENRKWYDFLKR